MFMNKAVLPLFCYSIIMNITINIILLLYTYYKSYFLFHYYKLIIYFAIIKLLFVLFLKSIIQYPHSIIKTVDTSLSL